MGNYISNAFNYVYNYFDNLEKTNQYGIVVLVITGVFVTISLLYDNHVIKPKPKSKSKSHSFFSEKQSIVPPPQPPIPQQKVSSSSLDKHTMSNQMEQYYYQQQLYFDKLRKHYYKLSLKDDDDDTATPSNQKIIPSNHTNDIPTPMDDSEGQQQPASDPNYYNQVNSCSKGLPSSYLKSMSVPSVYQCHQACQNDPDCKTYAVDLTKFDPKTGKQSGSSSISCRLGKNQFYVPTSNYNICGVRGTTPTVPSAQNHAMPDYKRKKIDDAYNAISSCPSGDGKKENLIESVPFSNIYDCSNRCNSKSNCKAYSVVLSKMNKETGKVNSSNKCNLYTSNEKISSSDRRFCSK